MIGSSPSLPAAMALATSLLLGSGCEGNDIGKPCRALLGNELPLDGGGRVEITVSAGQQACFDQCEDLICVAYEGTGGYCSRKCRNDDDCPDAFSCEVVIKSGDGPLRDVALCVWKHCGSADQCGDPERFTCEEEVPDPEETIRRCSFTETEGSCAGVCGGRPEGGDCYCDAICDELGDCCSDRDAICTGDEASTDDVLRDATCEE